MYPKIRAIKKAREVLGLGLVEAKNLIEALEAEGVFATEPTDPAIVNMRYTHENEMRILRDRICQMENENEKLDRKVCSLTHAVRSLTDAI